VLCCAVLCCAVLCCAVLCCAVLCCAVLCCTVCRSQAISARSVQSSVGCWARCETVLSLPRFVHQKEEQKKTIPNHSTMFAMILQAKARDKRQWKLNGNPRCVRAGTDAKSVDLW
jgi:hypothetical protein